MVSHYQSLSTVDSSLIRYPGWNKRLAYCIAFSADGATDVTRRYCRNPAKHGLDRTKAPESVLLYIMDEIRHARRRNLNKEDKFRLEGEDMLETRELRHYYVSALTAEVARLIPTKGRRLDPDAQKALEGRQSGKFICPPVCRHGANTMVLGSAEWRRARGEDGRASPRNPPPQ